MPETRKLIVYIACSLDGYIAGPKDDLSFLALVEKEGEDYGYNAFIQTVDTVVMGRRTYDWVINQVDVFPHADKQTFIITHRPQTSAGDLQFYDGSLKVLATELKSQAGKHIFCDGGAMVVNELLKEDLIDEFILSVVPVLLGDGIPLFQKQSGIKNLELASVKQFETGLVQMHYIRKR